MSCCAAAVNYLNFHGRCRDHTHGLKLHTCVAEILLLFTASFTRVQSIRICLFYQFGSNNGRSTKHFSNGCSIIVIEVRGRLGIQSVFWFGLQNWIFSKPLTVLSRIFLKLAERHFILIHL